MDGWAMRCEDRLRDRGLRLQRRMSTEVVVGLIGISTDSILSTAVQIRLEEGASRKRKSQNVKLSEYESSSIIIAEGNVCNYL